MTDHTANPPPSPAPPHTSSRRRAWRTLAGALLGLTLACAGIGAWTIQRIWTQLPSVGHLASARNAFVMDSMLRDVVKAGTARGALALRRADAAGKAGTSNGSKDVWSAGYSSGIVAVAWLGYDTPHPIGRATGATLALPVWFDYMGTAADGRTPVEATPPQDVALVDGDFGYAEYTRGTCTADVPAYIHSRFACGGAVVVTGASGTPGDSDKSGEPMPAAVDAAERERVLDLFRTDD